MKVGLLLEGGGMRGLYTNGVLDILMDNNIQIDEIVGVSAGALFGINYFSNQRGRPLRYNKRFAKDKRYMGFRSWLKTGNFVNREFTYYEMPVHLDIFDNEKYIESGKKLIAVATNVHTGKAEYFPIDNPFHQVEELRASSALPFLSKFVELNNNQYLDGGIADSIPINYMLDKNYDKIIVVLTQPKNYKKSPSHPKLNQFIYKNYPNLVKVLNNRHQNYNQSTNKVRQLAQEGKIFVIQPSEAIKVKRLDKNPNILQNVYNIGVKDANNQIEQLKEFLKS